MNIEEITRIVSDKYPKKEERIIGVLAESKDLLLYLLKIATIKDSQQKTLLHELNLALSESEMFIDKKCKPTPKERGITREYLLKKIGAIYGDFNSIIKRT